MKNILFALLTIAGLFDVASAAPAFPRMDVRELAVDVSTTNTISISSYTGTAVADPSVFSSTSNIWGIEVFVPSGATKVNCGWAVGVSTISTENDYGREVAAGAGVLWQTDYNKNFLRCKSQSTSAATRATITLFR